jgi:hypothetical protein
MNENVEKIFEKYEEIVLQNLGRAERGEEICKDSATALSENIRMIHHIVNMRLVHKKAESMLGNEVTTLT